MPAPARAPIVYTATGTVVPRDLIASVGALTGFGVIRFEDGRPLYDDCFIDAEGEMHAVEIELSLPHVCQRIMESAPGLALSKNGQDYVCALKEGHPPARGSSLIEAVFRAFIDAKAQPFSFAKAA